MMGIVLYRLFFTNTKKVYDDTLEKLLRLSNVVYDIYGAVHCGPSLSRVLRTVVYPFNAHVHLVQLLQKLVNLTD